MKKLVANVGLALLAYSIVVEACLAWSHYLKGPVDLEGMKHMVWFHAALGGISLAAVVFTTWVEE